MLNSTPPALSRQLARSQEFIRFCLVGVSGLLINSAALWLLVHSLGLPIPVASAIATELAILSNFLLNDSWTFGASRRSQSFLQRLLRYNSVAFGGMLITAAVLTGLTALAGLPLLLANVVAVLCATLWNYLINSRWTWAQVDQRAAFATPAPLPAAVAAHVPRPERAMTLLVEGQAPRVGANRISTEGVLAAALFVCILGARLASLDYNTAFVDESIYLSVGQRVLEGNFRDNALQWMTGSYLYPVMVALSAQLFDAGLIGARVFSVLAASLAVPAVFFISRRLFDDATALLATAIFGFAGISVYTSALATYDTLGIGMLGLSAWALTWAMTSERPLAQVGFALAAALCFALSVLSKYIALAWLIPVAALGLVLLFGGQWRRLAVLVGAFGLPLLAMLVGYGAWIWADLQLFLAQFGSLTGQRAPRLEVLERISYALRLPFLLAALGLLPLLHERRPRVLVPLLLLWVAALVMPLHHLVGANARSIDKSMTYALIFLAPLAGFGLVTLLRMASGPAIRRTVALAAIVVACAVGLQLWNDQAWLLQRTWINLDDTLAYLRELPVTPETQILAEGGNLYDFYLGWGERAQVTTTWAQYFAYGGVTGEAAMQAALADGYFDYLILDRYYTPELSASLAQAAEANGYTLVFSDQERVLGEEERIFTIQVFASPAN